MVQFYSLKEDWILVLLSLLNGISKYTVVDTFGHCPKVDRNYWYLKISVISQICGYQTGGLWGPTGTTILNLGSATGLGILFLPKGAAYSFVCSFLLLMGDLFDYIQMLASQNYAQWTSAANL